MTKKKNKKLINVLQFAGFGFPALFIWMSVVIIPFIYGIWITFTDWNGLAMHINYVGLQNYIDVFKDATFVSFFDASVTMRRIKKFFTVLASNIVGFALALAVTSGIKGQGLFRTGFFTPNIIGGIILGYIWNFIFSYVLTAVGKSMGVEWMSTSSRPCGKLDICAEAALYIIRVADKAEVALIDDR